MMHTWRYTIYVVVFWLASYVRAVNRVNIKHLWKRAFEDVLTRIW